jgi:hypothetical protein
MNGKHWDTTHEQVPYFNSPADPLDGQQDLLTAIIKKQQPLYDYSSSPAANAIMDSPLAANLPGSNDNLNDMDIDHVKILDNKLVTQVKNIANKPSLGTTSSPVSEQPPVPYVNPYGDLAEMQATARGNMGNISMLEGLTNAGKSIATAGRVEAAPVKYDDLRAMALQPIKDRAELIKNANEEDKMNPNSPSSIASREMMAKMMDMTGNATGANAIRKGNMSLQQLETVYGNVTLEKLATMHESMEARKATAALALSAKKEMRESTAYQKASNDMEHYRGNNAAQQAAVALQNGRNALALAQMPGKSVEQLQLLAMEMAKMATGGVPGHAEIKTLVPDTVQTRLSLINKFLSNKPSDAQAGAFVKQNVAYINEMMNNYQNGLNDYKRKVLSGYKHSLPSEMYSDLEARIGETGTEGKKQTTSDDAEAVKWAQKNKSDPRAQQILKMHGMS